MSAEIMTFFQQIALMAVPILVAVTFHELAHGLVADRLGDPTPRSAGRLTLNPIKHLDPIGAIVFIITRTIGWARPVPVNPYNFKDPVKGMLYVSLAGPLTNFLIAFIASLIYKAILNLQVDPQVADRIVVPLALMVRYTVILNIGIGVFNLLPVPPLDGSKILMGLLPPRLAMRYARIEPFGFIILLGLIILGIVDIIIFPVVRLLAGLLI
jgi:Zn-dependent protease